MTVSFQLNGSEISVADDRAGRTLLDALRAEGGITSAKDGCAPQGQCGCCTVLVDGRARVACVTPLRRVGGREVETVEGLDTDVASAWADAFVEHGASQCGFCTPGIVMRLEDRRRRLAAESAAPGAVDRGAVERTLAAHLCRCTGWQGITDAAVSVLGSPSSVSPASSTVPLPSAAATGAGKTAGSVTTAASLRATLETGGPQSIDRAVVLGGGAFAADTVPSDALFAVVGTDGEWVVADSIFEARQLAGKVQGRRTTEAATPPIAVPNGEWEATLSTSWVEPGYLETDASWCEPGGEPASPLANGGGFGAKRSSPVPAAARRLADAHGRAVLAMWAREDAVRQGSKRPPLSIGIRGDGSGVLRGVATPGLTAAVALATTDLVVEEVEVPGPPTSMDVRAAGWAEAVCALVAVDRPSARGGRDGRGVRVVDPSGGWARVEVLDGSISVSVGPGDPLDETVLTSFVTGAVHMAAGWVCSEGLAVDDRGTVGDLTIRSFGILPASAMVPVSVVVDDEGARGEPVAVGDVVFAATAAALWWHHGFGPTWPLGSTVL